MPKAMFSRIGFAEQKSFLRDEADLPAQRFDGIVAHRSAINQYASRLSVVDRGIRLTRVVFPDPVGPTMARLLPAGTRRLMSCNTGTPS